MTDNTHRARASHGDLDTIDRYRRAANARARHREWIVEHGEDLPEIREWKWMS